MLPLHQMVNQHIGQCSLSVSEIRVHLTRRLNRAASQALLQLPRMHYQEAASLEVIGETIL